jgi:hypothetical protein
MTPTEMTARSRAAQGLPARIEDPATLARVAALLRPDDLDAGGVEPVETSNRRMHDDALDGESD